jgi:hypothetical protein
MALLLVTGFATNILAAIAAASGTARQRMQHTSR